MNLNNAAFMPQRVRTAIRRNARWLLRLTAFIVPEDSPEIKGMFPNVLDVASVNKTQG